jgi:hypothetical protein
MEALSPIRENPENYIHLVKTVNGNVYAVSAIVDRTKFSGREGREQRSG